MEALVAGLAAGFLFFFFGYIIATILALIRKASE